MLKKIKFISSSSLCLSPSPSLLFLYFHFYSIKITTKFALSYLISISEHLLGAKATFRGPFPSKAVIHLHGYDDTIYNKEKKLFYFSIIHSPSQVLLRRKTTFVSQISTTTTTIQIYISEFFISPRQKKFKIYEFEIHIFRISYIRLFSFVKK